MSVVINATNFPDEELRTYVARDFDLNSDGILSDAEIAKVTKLTLTASTRNIKVIEIFTNLEELNLYWGCHYAELDFSKFPKLKKLSQTHAGRIEGYATPASYQTTGYRNVLDFSANSALIDLYIGDTFDWRTDVGETNPIQGIRFPSALQFLYIYRMCKEPVTLDFTGCSELRTIHLSEFTTDKQLSIRGLNNKRYLTTVEIYKAHLDGRLDLSNNVALESIVIVGSDLSQAFSITNCSKLTTFCVPNCNLSESLNLSSFSQLAWIDVSNNKLNDLVLGTQMYLKYLFIGTDKTKHAIASVNLRGFQRAQYWRQKGELARNRWAESSLMIQLPSTGYHSYNPETEYIYAPVGVSVPVTGYIEPKKLNSDCLVSYDPNRTTPIWYPSPVIVEQPSDVIAASGSTAGFVIKCTGESVSFQWQYSRSYRPDSDTEAVWYDIAQSNHSAYSLSVLKADSDNYYRCVVSNNTGSVISEPAKLTVLDAVEVTGQPALSDYVAIGTSVVLSLSVTGDNPSYQWQVSVDGSVFEDITEATSDTYTIQVTDENNSKYYRCKVWNPVSTVFSSTAQLHVAYSPSITRPPVSQTVKAGEVVDLSIGVSGGGSSYQWSFSSNDGTTWTPIEGAVGETYSFATVRAQSGYRYRCVVTNPVGTVTSAAATITVMDPPVITSQPTLPDDVPEGTHKTLPVQATGDNLFYQWQVSNNGSTFLNISGAEASDYTFTASKENSRKYYRCSVWNAVGNVTSGSVYLHVVFQPEITQHPLSGTVESGVSVMLSVKATGESLKYQWQARANSSSDWQDLTDITAASYSFTPVRADSGMQYRCVITNAAGTAISDTATLTVLDPPVIITQPSLPADVIGESQYTLTVEATGDDLSYQWQVSTNGSLFEEIDGAWSATYDITATSANSGNQYRCFISNAVGSAFSSAATVHVVYQPEILQQPVSSTVETGKAITLSTEVSGDSLNHQWQYSSNNGANWLNIATGTNKSYSFTAERSQSGYKYRCRVSNIVGSVITDVVTITVMDPPVITSQPSLPEIVSDGSVNQLSVTATGDSRSYQWQESSNGYTYVNIADAVRATYALTVSRENAGHQYRCIVSNAVGEVVTTPVTVNLLFQPEITATDFPDSIVQNGDAVRLAIMAIGGSLTYQWQVSVDNEESWSNLIDGTGKPEYAFAASISQSGYAYRCVVTNQMGTATSETAVLNVLSPPAVISDPESVIVGEGNLVTFRVSANGSNISYQWQASSDYGSIWADLPNESSYQYAFVAERGQSERQYRCRVYNDLASVFSAAAVLTVLTAPEILTSPKSLTVSYAKTAVFQVIATGGSLKYQWQSRPNDAIDWTNIASGGTSDTYSFVALDTENGYQYRCFVLNDAGSVYSDAATLTVTEYEDPEQSEDLSVHDGEYLPAQMAEAICALITYPEEITDLDDVYFGNMPNDSVYDYLDRSGYTDPGAYERIAEALNEIKDYLKTMVTSEDDETPVPSGGGGELDLHDDETFDDGGIAGVDSDIDSSVDLRGKTVSELQSGIQVADETITGASLYVYDYPDFSTDESLQSGNFLALHLEGSSTYMVIPRLYFSSDYAWHEIPHVQVGDYLIMRLGSITLTTLELTAYKNASAVWSSAFNISGIARQRAY